MYCECETFSCLQSLLFYTHNNNNNKSNSLIISLLMVDRSYDSDSYVIIGFTNPNPCLIDYFVLCNTESLFCFFRHIILIDDDCIEWGQNKLLVLVLLLKRLDVCSLLLFTQSALVITHCFGSTSSNHIINEVRYSKCVAVFPP